MLIANGTHKTAARICDALGLKDVRALSLSMAVDDAVMLAVTQYVTGDQMERFAGELETRQYVLVPKDEWDRVTQAKSPAVLSMTQERLLASCGVPPALLDGVNARYPDPHMAKLDQPVPIMPAPPEVE